MPLYACMNKSRPFRAHEQRHQCHLPQSLNCKDNVFRRYHGMCEHPVSYLGGSSSGDTLLQAPGTNICACPLKYMQMTGLRCPRASQRPPGAGIGPQPRQPCGLLASHGAAANPTTSVHYLATLTVKHCSTFKWPPIAALAHVSSLQGQPLACAHVST